MKKGHDWAQSVNNIVDFWHCKQCGCAVSGLKSPESHLLVYTGHYTKPLSCEQIIMSVLAS